FRPFRSPQLAICPAFIRYRPGVVMRNRPSMSAMYPSAINLALCAAGIAGAKPFTGTLPTVSREANSSPVSAVGSDAMA
ncbi:hypothetical protein, partial [Bradyrhizobium sp. S69]|uniref:hypothetical protein n=1 Tax=Bradyrhizobium sp. S69 TaxID=1641856 RepID=UPI001AEED3FF